MGACQSMHGKAGPHLDAFGFNGQKCCKPFSGLKRCHAKQVDSAEVSLQVKVTPKSPLHTRTNNDLCCRVIGTVHEIGSRVNAWYCEEFHPEEWMHDLAWWSTGVPRAQIT